MSYLYTLKRELAWLENPSCASSLPCSALSIPSSSPQVKLLSGDGFSVSLPLPLLLASSSLLQSAISSHHCCGSTDISIPSVAGRTLVLVGEILRRGETSQLAGAQHSGESLKDVQWVMDLLQCGVSVVLKQKERVQFTRLRAKKEHGSLKNMENLIISSVTSINSWEKESPSDPLSCLEFPGIKEVQQEVIIKEELDISFDGEDDEIVNEIPNTNEKSKITVSKSVCPICDKLVKVRYLNGHIINMHPESTYSCPICEFKFVNETNLKKHLAQKHKPGGPEQKDVCDKDSTFPCPICAERFLLKGSRKAHIRLVHGGYNCNACPKNFSTEDLFKRHVESAHMKVRFSCSQCDKLFVTKTNADKHCKLEGHSQEGIVKFKLKDGKPTKKK